MIIGQVKKEFPLFPVTPISLTPAPTLDTNKASGSGTKEVKQTVSKASPIKSEKPKSSPTESLDVKSIKKYSKSELKMLALALSERISELQAMKK